MKDHSTTNQRVPQFGIKAMFFWTTFLASTFLAMSQTKPMTVLTMGFVQLALLIIAKRVSPETLLLCGLLWLGILSMEVAFPST